MFVKIESRRLLAALNYLIFNKDVVYEKNTKNYILTVFIVVLIISLQVLLFFNETLTDAGLPPPFLYLKLTGNVSPPLLGEIYTPTINWANLFFDSIIYFLVICFAINVFQKILKRGKNGQN